MRITVLSLCLFGCSPLLPLPDVPIIGGSADMRALVREELAAFEANAGPGRVQLTEIAFQPMEAPIAGMYQRMRERVVLSESQALLNIPRMVRHELCHALDRQEGLLDASVDAFDTFGELLFDPDEDLMIYHKNARGRRSEALAIVCERGPFGASALSQPCEGESELASALADFAAHNVWIAYEMPASWPEIATPHASYQPQTTDDWTAFDIIETDTSNIFVLSLGYDDHGEQLAVDVRTGTPAEGSFTPDISEPPWPGLPSGEYRSWLSAPDGASAAIGTFSIRDLWESYSERLLASDGDEWALVGDGCIEREPWQSALFGADEQLWYAWGDGRAVQWAALPTATSP